VRVPPALAMFKKRFGVDGAPELVPASYDPSEEPF
jgi:hypothetical protein